MSSSEQKTSRRRRWPSRILLCVTLLVVLLVVLAVLAPTLLSTGPGTRLVEAIVNKVIPGTVRFDALDLAWFSGQQVSGLSVRDPGGKQVLHVDSIDVPDATLWALATGGRDLGIVRVVKPVLPVEQDEAGNINLLAALVDPNKPPSDEPTSLPAGLRVQLQIVEPQVTYTAPGVEMVKLLDTSADVQIKDPKFIHVALKTNVEQGEARGLIDADVTIHDLFDAAGVMQQRQARVDAVAKLKNGPIEAADRLLKLHGQLLAAVGPSLDADLVAQLEAGAGGGAGPLSLTLKSQRLNGRIAGQLTDGRLAVSEPGQFTASLQPALIEAIGRAYPQLKPTLARIEIQDGAKLTVALTRASAPLNAKPEAVSAAVRVRLQDVAVHGDDQSLVQLPDTTLSVDYDGPTGKATVDLAGQALHAGQTADIAFNADAQGLSIGGKPLDPARASVVVKGKLARLFLDPLGRLLNLGDALVTAVGPTLDVTVDGRVALASDVKGVNGSVTLMTTAQRHAGKFIATLAGGRVVLAPLTQTGLTVTPALLAALDKAYPDLAPALKYVQLKQPVDVQVTIEDAAVALDDVSLREFTGSARVTLTSLTATPDPQLPIDVKDTAVALHFDGHRGRASVQWRGHSDFEGQTASVDLTASATELFDNREAFKPLHAKVTVGGQVDGLFLAAVDRLMKLDGLLVDAVGPGMDIGIDGALALAPKPADMTGSLTLTTKAARHSGKFIIALAGGRATLAPQTQAGVTLMPALLAKLANSYPQLAPALKFIELKQPTDVTVALQRASVSVQQPGLSNVSAAASVTMGTWTAVADPKLPIAMKNTAVDVTFDGQANNATVRWRGQADDGQRVATIDLTTHAAGLLDKAGKLDTSSATATVKGTVAGIFLAAVDQYLALDGLAVEAIGPTIDADVDGRVKLAAKLADMTGTLALTTRAQRFDGRFTGSLAGGRIVLKPDTTATLTAQPALLAKLAARSESLRARLKDLQLAGPAKFQIDIDQFDVPLSLDPRQAKLIVRVKSDEAAFRHKEKGFTIALRDVLLALRNGQEPGMFGLNVQADTQTRMADADKPIDGKITSKSRVFNLADKDGKLDVMNATVQTNTTAQNVPVALVDALSGSTVRLSDVVGPLPAINTKGSVDLAMKQRGNFDLGLAGQFANVSIDGTIDKGVVALRRDVVGTFVVRPEFANVFLKRVHPFLADALSADKPVRITVRQQDFVAPLTDFDIKKVKAVAQLELGTMTLGGGGPLGQLLKVFNFAGAGPKKAVFTPLNAQLQNGVLSYNDMTMTIDNITLGFAGRVDWASGRVNLVTLIPGQTFTKVWKEFRGVVGPDYAFQLPLVGTIDHPELDMKALTGEIATLGLKAGLAKGLGGKAPPAVGGLLNSILSGKKKPPPSKNATPDPRKPDTNQPTNDSADGPIDLTELLKRLRGQQDADKKNGGGNK